MFGLKRAKPTGPTANTKNKYVVKVTRNSNRAAKRGLFGLKIVNGVKKWVDCFSQTYIKSPDGQPARTMSLYSKQTSRYVPHVGKKQLRKQKAKASLVN